MMAKASITSIAALLSLCSTGIAGTHEHTSVQYLLEGLARMPVGNSGLLPGSDSVLHDQSMSILMTIDRTRPDEAPGEGSGRYANAIVSMLVSIGSFEYIFASAPPLSESTIVVRNGIEIPEIGYYPSDWINFHTYEMRDGLQIELTAQLFWDHGGLREGDDLPTTFNVLGGSLFVTLGSLGALNENGERLDIEFAISHAKAIVPMPIPSSAMYSVIGCLTYLGFARRHR